jgi:flagellin-like hook-associated protein FlgL
LGIAAATDGGTLRGSDIRSAPDRDTLLTDISGLAGKLPLGSVEILWEGGTTNLNLGSAVTLGDVQDQLAAVLPGMELTLTGGYLRLVGPSSEAFTVRDPAGSGTAAALGISGQGTPSRLFGVMEDLQAALTAGDKAAVHGAVSELMSLGRTLTGLLVKNGGRQNDLDWADGILRQRDERLRTHLSLERDVDVARVAADLSRAQASYQASLLVTSKLFGNNLMQYLR